MSNFRRKRLAVLFGGRSSEHEISIITALQAISAIDTLRYEVIPIYVDTSGLWYTGEALLDKSYYRTLPASKSAAQRVAFLSDPTIQGVIPVSSSGSLSLDKVIPIDVYFVAFHGQYGEDGCLQGMLEMANAAYTGCDVASSSIAMNKYDCKMFLKAHGIPVLASALVSKKAAMQDLRLVQKQILETEGLGEFPLFIKPCHLGSSIGISIATDMASLNAGLAKAFTYDYKALVEPCVTNILEINVSVLDGNPPIASVVEIPVATNKALTYEDKYLRGGTKSSKSSQGMAGLSRIINPKDLDPTIRQMVQEYAIKAYTYLGCSGVSRFDFMYDTSQQQLYFNELNPIPGSLAFYLWAKSDPQILYTEMIERMINSAIERKMERLTLTRDIGFKALMK
jgi:D-alanine-D-alanine ligase